VEEALRKHPAVAACRVIGTQHPVLGMVPVAEIVAREGTTPLPRELTEWCRARLSAYKVPARFTFVDRLELTASGKIRRH
jgi:long-chain acyl-CoA synthetase